MHTLLPRFNFQVLQLAYGGGTGSDGYTDEPRGHSLQGWIWIRIDLGIRWMGQAGIFNFSPIGLSLFFKHIPQDLGDSKILV